MISVPDAGLAGARGELCGFRQEFYRCLPRRADALFELADAVLTAAGPVRSLVELSLAGEHRRGHGSLYAALAKGGCDTGRLRRALAGLPLPRAADGRLVLAVEESPYPRDEIRRALRSWAFSARLRGESEPPADLADVVRWLEGATISLEELVRPGSGTLRTRALLGRISRKKDGTIAAANTANRKRMVLSSVLDYACETRVLAVNPVRRVKWARPRALKTVDPRIVINIDQAQRLLAAIGSQGNRGERLEAFFACMYYAALRPEEVIGLRRSHLVSLPAQGWGELRLTHSEPRSGARWTDNGRSRERRELKHRAAGDTRSVPIHPDLARLLRAHLNTFGTGRDGRVFAGPRGGIVAEWVYLEVYHRARKAAFTGAEAQSQLAETPYALRHAAVSTWLNAGVGAPQVAERAGHSVEVLLRVYAKCIAGQQDEAKRRILRATRLGEPDANP